MHPPRCEVCENFRPGFEAPSHQKLVEMSLDVRSVILCTGHARIAVKSGVTSFEALRALYGSGRRSFVPRRRTDRAGGRRATDTTRP
jgi:hypothetical protein